MSKIKVDYIDHMGDDLRVVNSARVSYGSYHQELEAKDVKLINFLAKHDHMSPFEHLYLTVKVSCPLYIRSQIMRHRQFSYNEISRRYTEKNIEFYIPPSFRKQHASSKQCSDGEIGVTENMAAQVAMQHVCSEALRSYKKMIKSGCAKELARGILPQCMMTEFYMSGNLRSYMNFLSLRLKEDAQLEAQIIANAMKEIIEKRFPESSKALLTKLNK